MLLPDSLPLLSRRFVLDLQTLDNPPQRRPEILLGPLALIATGPLLLFVALVFLTRWVLRGALDESRNPFLKPRRLQEVLALVQVLSLHRYPYRSAHGIEQDAKGSPESAADWKALALEHPEFFRVDNSKEHQVSLIARHSVASAASELDGASLAADLAKIAIELAGAQEKRALRWGALAPIFGAIMTAGLTAVSLLSGHQ